jgi:hypothetical protein
MKKIKLIAIVLSFMMLVAHVGCMSTSSPARGGLSGVISDSTGNPLSGVRVATTEASTLSDVNGKWMLESLTPQLTQITASREKFQPQTKNIEVLSGEMLDEINFVMAADSEIYDIQVSSVTSTKARIVFYTKKQSIGHVRYGTNGLLNGTTVQDAVKSFMHQYELTNLTPATTYRFKCIATDELGRKLESELQNFTTEATVRGDPPTNLKAVKLSDSNSIQLTWDTAAGVDFAGYKLYKAESANGIYIVVGSGVINNNSYADMEVLPGRKYYYRVTRLSGSGDETPKSEPVSFLMPGRMNQNAVWSKQNSPYLLTGDLSVAPGVSLVIEKGVSIGVARNDQWDADSVDDKIEILVQGTLMIQGTNDDPVSITSTSSAPQAGDWEGIIFDTVADLSTSLVKGLRASCAVNAINGRAGVPTISESRFFNCREAGVKVSSAREPVVIRNSEFDTCSSGINARNNDSISVQISDCTILRCIYGIVCRDNKSAEIMRNRIGCAGVYGIDVGNNDSSSLVKENLIGYGSSGTGIMVRGKDEIRRNTVQANIGIELKETAAARVRSNLLLAEDSRNGIGVIYSGSANYSTASNTFQFNAIWDIATGNARRYLNSDGTALPGISSDLRFDPALAGGDPFVELPSLSYSYVPSPGSPLKAAGYDNEDVGAFNVPN